MSAQKESSGKSKFNKIGGVFLMLVGAVNLISLPFTEPAGKFLYYLILGIVLLGGGFWLFRKESEIKDG